ncbi:biopolymer transporter ExbD [Amylibacter sp. SFDW26]|uniref:ExbD/TolR family protein n=1 Tax=Amylibacter sp. SFDW26 TaxID=2652722 RepID=UPI001261DA6F|nr:biopolymer transporter ExbD [Amylibacter sp. SFDW26]KAB7615857.1 biopolymer transporter ExbD [Amylibacter sp. SFDW26]
MHLGFEPRQRRKPSLTPMIDVVFLLLVFFMLASRFGMNSAIEIPLAGAGGEYTGPPRLIDVLQDSIRLNGIDIGIDLLANAVADLTKEKTDVIILRGKDGASLQRIVDISVALKKAGFQNLVLVE